MEPPLCRKRMGLGAERVARLPWGGLCANPNGKRGRASGCGAFPLSGGWCPQNLGHRSSWTCDAALAFMSFPQPWLHNKRGSTHSSCLDFCALLEQLMKPTQRVLGTSGPSGAARGTGDHLGLVTGLCRDSCAVGWSPSQAGSSVDWTTGHPASVAERGCSVGSCPSPTGVPKCQK